jgi:hypothetical protein
MAPETDYMVRVVSLSCQSFCKLPLHIKKLLQNEHLPGAQINF